MKSVHTRSEFVVPKVCCEVVVLGPFTGSAFMNEMREGGRGEKRKEVPQKMKRKNTGRHKADPYQADPSEDLSHRPVMVGMQKMDCFFSCSLIYATIS